MLDGIVIGLNEALSWNNLLYCFIGVCLGTVLGAMPGISTLIAMSLLFPITFHLDAAPALIMLAGIFYGTSYGGSTTSILLNLPGTPSNAVACVEGYPMGQQGRAAVAIFITAVGSFVGASIGILLMMLASPVIVETALLFGSFEYFGLMVLGLLAASTVSTGQPIKGIAMVVLGVLFGTVGADMITGTNRFTFGSLELEDGLSLVALAIGLFGVPEIIASVREMVGREVNVKQVTLRSMIPTRDDWRRSWPAMLRGAGIGSFFGAIPGTGGMSASFMAYAVEKKMSKSPERFGHGAIEGLVAPETANNAADQTAFIPTLTLGIPGTTSMALLLGILMIHGITPGPTMIVDHPKLFWGLIMSFWIGNIMLCIINIPLIGLWVRILTIPYHYLYPAILTCVCLGIYSIDRSQADLLAMLSFAILGYAMRLLNFSGAPLILGFVLGPMLEENLRRAMIYSRGSLTPFIERPVSAVILGLCLLILFWSFFSYFRERQRSRLADPLAGS